MRHARPTAPRHGRRCDCFLLLLTLVTRTDWRLENKEFDKMREISWTGENVLPAVAKGLCIAVVTPTAVCCPVVHASMI
jgi:hypothetical protein